MGAWAKNILQLGGGSGSYVQWEDGQRALIIYFLEILNLSPSAERLILVSLGKDLYRFPLLRKVKRNPSAVLLLTK